MRVPRGQNYSLEQLTAQDFEYKLIEKAFVDTGKSNMDPQSNQHQLVFGGHHMGGQMGGANALLPHPKSPAIGRILKIEKIYNPTIFDKFSGELKR